MYQVIDDCQIMKNHEEFIETALGSSIAFYREASGGPLSKPYFGHCIMDRIEDSEGYIATPRSRLFFPALNLIKEICISENIQFKELGRCYINVSHPDGSNGLACGAHVDHTYPHIQMLAYLNDSDGNTILYDKQADYNNDPSPYTEIPEKKLIEISPKKYKVVLFDGSLYHTAHLPTNSERTVLVATIIV